MGIADQQALDFYLTPEHECSYLPGRTAQTLFADPSVRIGTSLYSQLIKYGLRRTRYARLSPPMPGVRCLYPDPRTSGKLSALT